MRNLLMSLIIVLMATTVGFGAEYLSSTLSDQQDVEVTVYNSNLGLVKDTRSIKLPDGTGELRFMDVASGIMPYTVHVESMSAPNDFMILEQNYEYDLMDSNKLLDKFVGKKIKLLENPYQDKKEIVEATLLSNNNGQIFQINNEIYLGHPGYKILPEIPENLIAKPTLTWWFDNHKAQTHKVKVSYLTNNINWRADYVLVVNQDDTAADLSGWVTLDNTSGATYKDAKLKLVAGEVNRAQDRMMLRSRTEAGLAGAMEEKSQFQEQAFFEYHIYDLQRRTTIKDNQTKQVSLLEANNLKVEREFIVRGDPNYFFSAYINTGKMKTPVNVYIKFKNSKENQVGMPLPAGIMRLYKEDGQKSLQFIGEDAIQHTPKDEDVELKVGEAFDVVAERVQTNFQQYNKAYDSEWEVTLRNHKDSDIKVSLLEPTYGDWEVLNHSHPFKKVDAHTMRFEVDVPKDQEVKVKYRVRVNYP